MNEREEVLKLLQSIFGPGVQLSPGVQVFGVRVGGALNPKQLEALLAAKLIAPCPNCGGYHPTEGADEAQIDRVIAQHGGEYDEMVVPPGWAKAHSN